MFQIWKEFLTRTKARIYVNIFIQIEIEQQYQLKCHKVKLLDDKQIKGISINIIDYAGVNSTSFCGEITDYCALEKYLETLGIFTENELQAYMKGWRKTVKILEENVKQLQSSSGDDIHNVMQEDRDISKTKCLVIQKQKRFIFNSKNGSTEEDRQYYYLRCWNVNGKAYNLMCRDPEKIAAFLRNEPWKNTSDNSINANIQIEEGHYNLLLPPGASALFFHECLGHPLEIQYAGKPDSMFYGKLGQKICSKKITFIDNPKIQKLWGSFRYDDEGMEAKKNVLIEKGVLKSFMVDTSFSAKERFAATSSARRENYKKQTSARMSNTYIEASGKAAESIRTSFMDGIIVQTMDMGQVDPLSGKFKIKNLTGILVETGKEKGVVNNVEICSNTIDIINNVLEVGDDLQFSAGFCGSESGVLPVCVGQPTMVVGNVLLRQK